MMVLSECSCRLCATIQNTNTHINTFTALLCREQRFDVHSTFRFRFGGMARNFCCRRCCCYCCWLSYDLYPPTPSAARMPRFWTTPPPITPLVLKRAHVVVIFRSRISRKRQSFPIENPYYCARENKNCSSL